MTRFILFCWLLANLLHPVMWLLLMTLVETMPGFSDFGWMCLYYIPFVLISLLASAPALFLCFPLCRVLVNSGLSIVDRFGVWLFLVAFLTCLNVYCLFAFFADEFSLQSIIDFFSYSWDLVLAPVSSVILSSFIGFKKFIKGLEMEGRNENEEIRTTVENTSPLYQNITDKDSNTKNFSHES